MEKVLGKGNPERRRAFIAQFQSLFEEICEQETILLYLDEAHIHRDMDLGYIWARKGQPALRLSHCPPLAHRINWYGASNFTQSQCFIWNEGNCNKAHPTTFLEHVAAWVGDTAACRVVIIRDGTPWHRAALVQQKAAEPGFEIVALPAYSPDLNPIEGLWKWLRQEVTQHHCYRTMRDLFLACQAFIERINLDPGAIIRRLWPKFELDTEFEKLLVSY